MSDAHAESQRPSSGNRRDQLLSRLKQLSKTGQAGAYAQVAQMLLTEMEPVQLVSALLSQVAAQASTQPIVTGERQPNRRPDVARMA
jgi:hypothetical protein